MSESLPSSPIGSSPSHDSLWSLFHDSDDLPLGSQLEGPQGLNGLAPHSPPPPFSPLEEDAAPFRPISSYPAAAAMEDLVSAGFVTGEHDHQDAVRVVSYSMDPSLF